MPLDGSSVAEAIIPFILDIAGPLDMKVVLLRVVEPIAPTVIEGSRHVEVEDVEARRTDVEEYLGRLMFGSVAQAVLGQVDMPVLLMRATEAQVARRVSREPMR